MTIYSDEKYLSDFPGEHKVMGNVNYVDTFLLETDWSIF
jgi:hypothetical protein